MAVTSYGRNKNHDDEIKKKQEKANNSLSYRCAAINYSNYNLFQFPSLSILKFPADLLDIAWDL